MLVFAAKPVVRLQCIAKQCRSRFDVLAHQRLQLAFAAFVYDLRAYLTATFQYCRYNRFTFWPAPSLNLPCLDITVHVPRFAANKSLVYFHFARQFSTGLLVLHPEPQPM